MRSIFNQDVCRMKPDLRKIPASSIVALAAIVFFCTSLALSIASFPPGFSPRKNWMSDLGHPELNPAGSPYFNGACMITGLSSCYSISGLKAGTAWPVPVPDH
jgi:hypothetical membrane protein